MKRLLIALAAVVAVLTASARVTDTQSFEESFSDFKPSVENVDESELVAYDNNGPSFAAPYDFDDFGLKYLSLDTGDATLWRTNTGNAAYLDMVMQFNPCTETPTVDSDTKISVYLNASSNLVVIADDGNGVGTPSNYVTSAELAPGTWARITVASKGTEFDLYLNTQKVGTYPSLKNDASILEVGFSGSGKLDDFVARTTDPFLQNPAATIGGEGYASLADALADDPTATPQLEADASYTIASRGGSVSVKLNNHNLALTVPEGLYAYPTTSEGVTTYTADYFPRTNTPGQDGTAANPYEIADVDDIAALEAAFAADGTFRSKNYKLVADIDVASLGYWDGIGTASGTNGDSGLNGGTFDGAGHTISNVKFTNAKYRGFFNQVRNSTIKDLTINVVDIAQHSNPSAEHGYSAFAGNMKNSKIQNCMATGTIGTTAKPAMHTCGGFAVKSSGGNVFENCTNYVDIVCSLTDNPKIGGIVGLVQEGTAALTNCWNYGDITITCKTCDNDGNGAGGLIGYGTTAITIYGGGNAGTIQSTDTTSATGTKPIKVGTIIAMQNASSATVSGGTVAQADAAPAGAFANVSGLTYATVDNNVATFVPDAELAAGNTYVLQQNVAASETPVFTLAEASDTISFDTAKGVTFAGTVAVDRSKLMPATSETVGTVTTYSTTAGVASVDGTAYATFDAALAALEGETTDDFVTLLADVTYAVSAGQTLRVKPGDYELTLNTAPDVIISRDLQDGVITYAAVEGVASVYHGGTTTWYATFAAAYDAANAITTGDYPTLTVKVGSDFTPVITYSQFFQKIKFESTTEDPITVNLKNAAGTYTMTAVGYQASANVTLVLPTDFTAVNEAYLTGGCTVEVPEGVTLTLASGSSGTLVNIGGLVGAGTLVAPTDAGALGNFIASEKYSGWLKAATWTGTLQCSGNATGVSFDNIANANASVRFCGFTNYVHNTTSASSFKAIELVGDGLTLAGEYSSAATYTFTNTLKGDGALNVVVNGGYYGNPLKTIQFTGDVSGFGGSITIADGANYKAHDVLIFGNDSSTVSNAVVVSAGVVMTNATGKTWNAPGGVVVNGTLVANGTVTTAAQLDGSGVYEVNATTAAITVADTWTGTYIANFKAANNAIFYIPVNASATTVINGVNGEFGGYPKFGSGAPNVAGEVVLNANWTIADGWSTPANATTFAKLSGSNSGNLAVEGTSSYADPIYYNITELDNYAGTLGGRRGNFVIGRVNVATQPADGARVVATAIGAYGSINDNVPLYVNGADRGLTLTYDASGAQGAGLYYYAPVVSYDVRFFSDAEKTDQIGETQSVVSGEKATAPAAPTKAGYTFTGWDPDTNAVITAATDFVAQWESAGGFDGGDGATFNIPAETQSALETKLPSGKKLADPVEGSTSGMTYAQAYALGLMDENTGTVEDLKATIEIVDGKVKVSLDDATAGDAYTVTLNVYEKASLSAEWPSTPKATYTLGNEGEGFTPGSGSGSAPAGFYKVEVSISNK